MRKNVAVRQRDLNRLQIHWGTHESPEIDTLERRIARAIANFIGTSQLYTNSTESKPGRPAGVRGCKRGTGRRSSGNWKQVECGEAGAWLEVLSELLQERYKWAMRPSAELTLALIARQDPRGPEGWLEKMPRWAVSAWAQMSQQKISLPTEEKEVYDSSEDTIVLTDEQLAEIEK